MSSSKKISVIFLTIQGKIIMLFTEILPHILEYKLVSRKRFGGQRSIKMTSGKIMVYWLNDKNHVCKSHWLPNRIDLTSDDWFIIK